jgi:hypothetical protein
MKRKDLLKTQSLFYTTAPLRFDHISAFLLQNGLWSLKFAFKYKRILVRRQQHQEVSCPVN